VTIDRLWLVRHGQSEGNVADQLAIERGSPTIDIDVRDPDVPLSELGRRQAVAVGRLLAAAPPERRPTLVVSSPFERAYDTAKIALTEAGLDLAIERDERVRERDLGLFDGLTGLGIRERYPDEATRRAKLGKFYYRPPRGESWADVASRVRALLVELRNAAQPLRVAVFSHQAVLFVTRYVVEGLSEREILQIDRTTRFHNGGVTSYECDSGGRLRLVEHDAIDHLDEHGAPATAGHDTHVDV
jgi:broad specificity phosphatase PhoE